MNEEKVISKAKKQNREAQTSLYNQYQTGWFMICLRYQRNRADALDAMQNGVMTIFQKMKQFDSKKGSFKSWSSRVIVNENLMLIRKNKSIQFQDSLEDHHQLKYDEETPIERLGAEELTEMIQKLPEGYRTVFNLFVMEGYSHKEIAELLDISVGTSKSQLSKAKRMLRHKLDVQLNLQR